MRIRLWMLLAALLLTGMNAETSESASPERRIWRGDPIRVTLGLEHERSVRVPGAKDLRAGLVGGPVPGLRIQSLGDRLFLLARAPFENVRLLIQSDVSSMLVDLTTSDGPQPPLELLADNDQPNVDADEGADTTPAEVGYVSLVRHAAQALYAPERLIPRDGIIVREQVRRLPSDILVRGARVSAEPVAAWRGEGPSGPLWVTAVRLQNRLTTPVVLDPREVRGQWLACAFQHARLLPAGREADTTTAYLVSDRPYLEALGAFARAVLTGERP
ncbi:MAG: TIGR03749 family integrating conjugative element protein [Candidatus Sedimenticola endophacoides]